MGRKEEKDKVSGSTGSSGQLHEMRSVEAPQTEEAVVPSSEVKEPGAEKRRYHTASYKLRIVREADLCRGEVGAIAALLRREGLYSSCLTTWRVQRDSGALSALSQVRGRKLKREPLVIENERLRKQMAQLEGKYRQSILIIEAQKKIAEILGTPIQGDPIAELENL